MNDPHHPDHAPADGSPEETRSALFAQLVLQQSNMATMLLGKTPHPESGQLVRDLDAARFFIDQLEMLEAKTKGNLTSDEATLLKQSLMALRMAYVEAVDAPPPPSEARPKPEAASAGAGPGAAPGGPAAPAASAPAEETSRPKFTKKY